MSATASNQFENPWRPNFEARACFGWLVGLAWMGAAVAATPLPTKPFAVIAAGVGLAGGVRMVMALRRWRRHRRLAGIQGLSFDGASKVNRFGGRQANKDPEARSGKKAQRLWLGYGLDWTHEVAQKAHSVLRNGEENIVPKAGRTNGAWWIHGVEAESDIEVPMKLLDGHSLLVGTTGSGKTTLFRVLIEQAIARDEAVIIIDPKGDKGMREGARNACQRAGDADRFKLFHPAHPDESVRLDPLRNWNRPTELASRVAALIPSESSGDPFTAFGWKVLNDVIHGLLETGERPTLTELRRYVEGSPEDLVARALAAHYNREVDNWHERVTRYRRRYNEDEAAALTAFYREEVAYEAPSQSLEGLIGHYTHNREHLQKMIASLIPILHMLTSGGLDELTSPGSQVTSRDKPVTDTSSVIKNAEVLYMGLDSLADSTVGSAIGSLFLADLTAVAADRYNYGVGLRPVNVFVDEASEVINDPTVALLNKGRGSRFRMHIATQTFSDFAARLGAREKATQVLGNCNNTVALRTIDADTQEFLVNKLPEVSIKQLQISYRQGADTDSVRDFNTAYQEGIEKEDLALFPQALFGRLPDLHYVGIFANGRVIKGRFPLLKEDGIDNKPKAQ